MTIKDGALSEISDSTPPEPPLRERLAELVKFAHDHHLEHICTRDVADLLKGKSADELDEADTRKVLDVMAREGMVSSESESAPPKGDVAAPPHDVWLDAVKQVAWEAGRDAAAKLADHLENAEEAFIGDEIRALAYPGVVQGKQANPSANPQANPVSSPWPSGRRPDYLDRPSTESPAQSKEPR